MATPTPPFALCDTDGIPDHEFEVVEYCSSKVVPEAPGLVTNSRSSWSITASPRSKPTGANIAKVEALQPLEPFQEHV